MIITRFPPSPTGDPHIGNIRTALFAYLFAKSQGGKFLFRIEDTDRERHVENSIQTIKDALIWLGITPENIDNPMIQSKRLEIYKKAALELVEKGDAYICTCSKERLEEVRTRQKALGQPPRYDGHCRKELRIKNEELRTNGIPEGAVIRMKIPETGKIAFDDLVRGRVEFDYSTLDDQVILKSDGFPTYHLASVIDDHEMKITHVIRAEEWLPSTPKHLKLYDMFGWEPPKFAHLPIILSPTHGKLSKRDGAVGIMEYKKMGYLPEALINFMVLLGWNPKTPHKIRGEREEEYFNLSELEKRFKIEQVNKAGAIFDINKLNYFNQYYIRQKSASVLVPLLDEKIVKFLPQENLGKIIEIAKQRMTTLSDFKEQVGFIVKEPKIDPQKLVFKKPALSGASAKSNGSTVEATTKALGLVLVKLKTTGNWTQDHIKAVLESIVNQNNLTNGDVFWPMRYSLSGEEKSPPPEELAEVLGKEKTVKRIKSALNILNS